MDSSTPGESINFSADVPEFVVNDRYRAKTILSEGSGGIVRYAVDMESGECVVLKTVPYIAGDIQKNILRKEHQTLLKLNHPNIVQALALHEDDNGLHSIRKFINGPTLREVIDRGPTNPNVAVRIIISISLTVSYLHRMRLFHRDLKPENVILVNNENVCLIDFGSAIEEEHLYVEEGKVRTTYQYASAEVLMGISNRVDRRSEVYSIGLILEELLNGMSPCFQGTKEASLLNAILRKSNPFSLSADVPDNLKQICQKCSLPTNQGGYYTADELAEALNHFLNRENFSHLASVARFDRARFIAWKLSMNFAESSWYHVQHMYCLPHITPKSEEEMMLDMLPRGESLELGSDLLKLTRPDPEGANTLGIVIGWEIQALNSFDEACFWALQCGINFAAIDEDRHHYYHRLIRKPRSHNKEDFVLLNDWAIEFSAILEKTFNLLIVQIPTQFLPLLKLRLLLSRHDGQIKWSISNKELSELVVLSGLPLEIQKELTLVILARQKSFKDYSQRLAAFDRLVESVLLYSQIPPAKPEA